MSVAEQWKEQGMQQGRFLEKQETARNFLGMGIAVDQVVKGTGLDLDTVLEIKNKINTEH
jgi:predicted transposase YdaD